MSYGKLVGDRIEYVPQDLILEDGRVVVDYANDIDMVISDGWKLIIDNKPSFDATTQYIRLQGYSESEDEIVKNYEIIDIVPSPTMEDRVETLEEYNLDIIVTTWGMDYRLLEVEWALEDIGLVGNEVDVISTFSIDEKTKGGNTMAFTRFEQAKIMILGGVYNKETLTKQLNRYLEKNILTKEEYDELISLMEAKELVVGE